MSERPPKVFLRQWRSIVRDDPEERDAISRTLRYIERLEADNAALRRERAAAAKCAARLHWLHTGGGRDPEGCEWGVFRVKWDANGQPVAVWQTNSDFSDLDAEMARESAAETPGNPSTPAQK